MKAILFFLFACFCFSLCADEKQYVILSEGEVYEGDYFASGSIIEISGTVSGDVFAFGSQILIDGDVLGSVIASGGTIEISGLVDGSARLAAGQVEISGTIKRNLTAAAGNLEIESKASISRNVVITGGMIDISGDIGGDLTMSGSNARLLAKVGRNVRAYVGELRLGSRADIKGNLKYSSHQKAKIDKGAKIGGEVIFKRSFITEIFGGDWGRGAIFGSEVLGLLMNFVFSFVIGSILLKFFPNKLHRSIQTLRTKPWKSFFMGLSILVIIPIAAIVLFITILGFPIAIALVAFSLLGFYAAKVIPIFWFSNTFLPKIKLKPNRLLTFAIGLLLFLILIRIPFLGGFLSIVFTLVGLGAITLGQVRTKNQRGQGSGEMG